VIQTIAAERRRAVALVAVAIVLSFSAFAIDFEDSLLFHPYREHVGNPRDYGVDYQDLDIRTADGELLNAWWIPAPGPATVLFLHGNGGNISYWTGKAKGIHDLGANLLLVDYRGYGRSTGKPSEEGTALDAQAAYDYLLEVRGMKPESLVIWGESLGGAVAARLATERPASGLIIESAFTSTPDLAPAVVPWIPFVRHLMRSRFDTLAAVGQVTIPKLFIHGDADQLIPFEMGRQLHDAAPLPKRFFTCPGRGHGSTYQPGDGDYLKAVGELIDQALSDAAGDPRSPGR